MGTGAEILSLSDSYPHWSFVGVDPSAAMLEVCRERLEEAGIAERCTLIHGYVQDAPAGETFDAALSILVSHFVARAQKPRFYREMTQRLGTGGVLVDAAIGGDFDSPAFPSMLENWKRVQALMGGTPESLAALPHMLRDVLSVIPPAETESLIRDSGIRHPVHFFQSFMITGWYGSKE